MQAVQKLRDLLLECNWSNDCQSFWLGAKTRWDQPTQLAKSEDYMGYPSVPNNRIHELHT